MKILKFSTPDCTWCKVVAPHVVSYAKEHDLELIDIDASKDEETANRYQVMGVPVVIFEDNGKVMAKATGYPEIMKLLNE